MKHTFRGALSAWMALIVLQTIGTRGGSGKIASLFSDVNGLVTRALSPDVAAIPDRRGGLSAGDTPNAFIGGITPNELIRGAGNAALLENGGAQRLNDSLNNAIPSAAAIDQLQKELGGLSNYTPEQLMDAYGIPHK